MSAGIMHGLRQQSLLVIYVANAIHSCIAYDCLTTCAEDARRMCRENETWVIYRHDMNGYVTVHWHDKEEGR